MNLDRPAYQIALLLGLGLVVYIRALGGDFHRSQPISHGAEGLKIRHSGEMETARRVGLWRRG